jgi:hypothetical protein
MSTDPRRTYLHLDLYPGRLCGVIAVLVCRSAGLWCEEASLLFGTTLYIVRSEIIGYKLNLLLYLSQVSVVRTQYSTEAPAASEEWSAACCPRIRQLFLNPDCSRGWTEPLVCIINLY